MKKISGSIKNMTFSDWVYWGMALVPFAISLVFYSRLPEQVPTHWNGAGEVNGYSSRLMACFGIPGFMLLMAVVVNFAFLADPKRANIARSRELKQITRWFIVLLAVLVQCITMLSGVGGGAERGAAHQRADLDSVHCHRQLHAQMQTELYPGNQAALDPGRRGQLEQDPPAGRVRVDPGRSGYAGLRPHGALRPVFCNRCGNYPDSHNLLLCLVETLGRWGKSWEKSLRIRIDTPLQIC